MFRTSLLHRTWKPGLLAATLSCLCIPLVEQRPANAGADYCQTDATGAYVCIHSVFGPRSSRGIIYTVNGSLYSGRVNCYERDYASTSITAVACWAYNAVTNKPNSSATSAKPADPNQMKLLLSNGKPSASNTISTEAVKSALPPEMK